MIFWGHGDDLPRRRKRGRGISMHRHWWCWAGGRSWSFLALSSTGISRDHPIYIYILCFKPCNPLGHFVASQVDQAQFNINPFGWVIADQVSKWKEQSENSTVQCKTTSACFSGNSNEEKTNQMLRLKNLIKAELSTQWRSGLDFFPVFKLRHAL